MRHVHLFTLSVCWSKLAGPYASLIEGGESENLQVHYFSRNNNLLFSSGGV